MRRARVNIHPIHYGLIKINAWKWNEEPKSCFEDISCFVCSGAYCVDLSVRLVRSVMFYVRLQNLLSPESLYQIQCSYLVCIFLSESTFWRQRSWPPYDLDLNLDRKFPPGAYVENASCLFYCCCSVVFFLFLCFCLILLICYRFLLLNIIL